MFNTRWTKDASRLFVRTVDTDVLVILIGLFHDMIASYPSAAIWIGLGMRKYFQYISLNSACAFLGPKTSRALPMFHSFTGCDTTSCFFAGVRSPHGKHGSHFLTWQRHLSSWKITMREIKLAVTWSYVKRQTAKMTSEFVLFSSNPSLNHIKIEKFLLLFATNTNISLTIQRAEDRRQKFHFCRLPFDVRPRNVKLNLSNEKETPGLPWPATCIPRNILI